MESLKFKIQGSSPEPYKVEFIKIQQSTFSAFCTCKAGQSGQNCKHRMQILKGDTSQLISDNIDDVKIIQSWVPNSDIEVLLNEISTLETKSQELKNALRIAKKSLSKALMKT